MTTTAIQTRGGTVRLTSYPDRDAGAELRLDGDAVATAWLTPDDLEIVADLLRVYAHAARAAEAVQRDGGERAVLGRAFSPTDLAHPLIARLGERVTYPAPDGSPNRAEGILANVTEDGLATLVDDRDIVVAVVAADALTVGRRR